MSVLIFLFLSLLTLLGKNAEASNGSGSLSFEQRVAYQRAVEEVYWRHRTWPSENKMPKPSLDQMMPDPIIRAKVEDYLKKSNALAETWQRPIQPEQLQAEMDRMARNTKQPDILRELFAALDNDPQVIAECLARPILVDRLIHNMYAGDERFHGALKAKVQAELRMTNTVEAMRALSGTYHESVCKKKDLAVRSAESPNSDGSLYLDDQQWTEWNVRLQQKFGSSREMEQEPGRTSLTAISNSSGSIPIGKLGTLQEDAEQFSVIAVLEKDDSHVKIATVAWQKQSFERWWKDAKQMIACEIAAPSYVYSLSPVAKIASCTDDTWKPTFTDVPSSRQFHTAIWTGTEMIVWGGYDGTAVNTGGRYNPSTDTWASGGTKTIAAPAGRFYHTAVWTGTEMIIWGGVDGTYLDSGGRYNPSTDTWASGGVSMNNAPSGRRAPAIWTGTEMVVWGGYDGSDRLQTGGRYNPSTDSWIPGGTNTANAPSGRYDHTLVWSGTEMIAWGGFDSTYTNTGGRYNPSTDQWTSSGIGLNDAPSGRTGHIAVWTGTEMIVWGGFDVTKTNTGGRYSPSTDAWVPGGTSMTDAPSARISHTAVWTGTEVIIWGGSGDENYPTLGGRYNPSTNTWIAGGTSPINAPSARYSHTAIWTGTEMIVWGGSSDKSGGRYDPTTNTWASGGTSQGNVPSGRGNHTATWTGTEMIIWGGYDGEYFNTGGRYDPSTDTWAFGTSMSGVPSPRALHTAVWTGTEVIVWGGSDNLSLATGGRYNPSTDTWSPGGTNMADAPSARALHTAIWTGTEMIVWGGNSGVTNFHTGGRYDPATDTWISGGTSTKNAPSARTAHSAVWTGKEMIIWGGNDGTFSNSGGRYDPLKDKWSVGGTTTTSAPSGRQYQTAIWSGKEMIVWGGSNDVTLNTGGRYNPSTDTWAFGGTSLTNAPSERLWHTVVWTGREMIVWGGYIGGSYLDTGGRYNPSTDTWEPNVGTSTVEGPSARFAHTGIWTGTEMVIWGGYGLNGHPITGGRYCAVPPAIFSDDFNDGDFTNPAPGWTLKGKGTCDASSGDAVCTTAKKLDFISPAFASCTNCTVEANIKLQTASERVSLFGWCSDKSHCLEMRFSHDKQQILIQHKAASGSNKKKIDAAILLNHLYNIKVNFDGANFHVSIDNVAQPELTLAPAGTPTGNAKFQTKSTTHVSASATLADIKVY